MPGKSTEDGGFVPTKKWDGKRVSIQKQDKQAGQIKMVIFGNQLDQDRKHMEDLIGMRQVKDGKKHWNVYPGGKIR
ncbi:hypothetical protein HYV11_00985 [Candidatus Dependentiae bacterium]|nr:hypothetical protein [Candidatus Dependentiae bacterium]